MLRIVHFQHAAPDAVGVHQHRYPDTLVPAALPVDIVVGGDIRAPRKFEYRLTTGGNPVSVVGVRPRNRAFLMHLLGDLVEPRTILGSVSVEVITRRLPGSVGDVRHGSRTT